MELLRECLYAIIIVVVPIVTKHIINFLEKKTEEISAVVEESKYSVLSYYVESVSEMIEDIVISVNQTYVSTLKSKGEFTKEAQEEAFNNAFNTAKEMLSEDSKIAIQQIYGDTDKFLVTMIEKYVNEHK